MAVLTNTKSSPALNGQSALVTLSGAEADANFSDLYEGQLCTIGSSSKTGHIGSIDALGISFKVIPAMPNTRFDSTDTPGILEAEDTVTTA